jgi:hypothetical protein
MLTSLSELEVGGILAPRYYPREVSMKILASLLATAALVGGVMVANAQQSGSSSEPSGPGAGGASPPGR